MNKASRRREVGAQSINLTWKGKIMCLANIRIPPLLLLHIVHKVYCYCLLTATPSHAKRNWQSWVVISHTTPRANASANRRVVVQSPFFYPWGGVARTKVAYSTTFSATWPSSSTMTLSTLSEALTGLGWSYTH